MTVARLGPLAVLAGAVIAGCGDPVPASVAGPIAPASPALLWDAAGLLHCEPLPADSVTHVVGPAGGTIDVGPHRLVVPAGALAQDVAITGVITSERARRVDFRPDGLTFAEPASLTMSYAGCGLAGLLTLQIALVSDDLAILQHLPSFTDVSAREVTGRLEHFSNYAVAW